MLCYSATVTETGTMIMMMRLCGKSCVSGLVLVVCLALIIGPCSVESVSCYDKSRYYLL